MIINNPHVKQQINVLNFYTCYWFLHPNFEITTINYVVQYFSNHDRIKYGLPVCNCMNDQLQNYCLGEESKYNFDDGLMVSSLKGNYCSVNLFFFSRKSNKIAIQNLPVHIKRDEVEALVSGLGNLVRCEQGECNSNYD